jgi:hypothetical protein
VPPDEKGECAAINDHHISQPSAVIQHEVVQHPIARTNLLLQSLRFFLSGNDSHKVLNVAKHLKLAVNLIVEAA